MEKYELIRSNRKTLALEITQDCRILVRAPLRLSQSRIDAFVESRSNWISKHLEIQQQRALSAPPPASPEEITALKSKARSILPAKVS